MARTRQITIRPGAELAVSGDTLVITLKADLDHHNAASIRECADQLLSQEGIRHVVFDFTGVEFMDSSGIGVIMGRYKTVSLIGGEVWAVHTNARIKKLLMLSGVTKIMQIYEEERI